jgi:membrane protease YdiL (CAAX protease family)
MPNNVWQWTDGPLPIPSREKSLDEYLAEAHLSFAEKYGLTGGGLLRPLLLAAAIGLTLGVFAQGYMAVLRHIPALADVLRKSDQAFSGIPGLRLGYAIIAIGFAPFGEEYLFRGLLFRALDREWGGWRAVLGAAAFFTVYHPLLAWLPVFCLGAVNCLLLKKTRRLVPCILLRMTYNAIVLMR